MGKTGTIVKRALDVFARGIALDVQSQPVFPFREFDNRTFRDSPALTQRLGNDDLPLARYVDLEHGTLEK